MSESIEQLALRVAREMNPGFCTDEGLEGYADFLARCLAELAKQQTPSAVVISEVSDADREKIADAMARSVGTFGKLNAASSLYKLPAAVPDGWKLVPVEPTKEMINAMKSSAWMPGNYRAMLSAAPLPPADDRIAEMERDVAQRKANREARRSRILKEMLDMPIGRVQVYEKWGQDQERIKELERQCDELLAALENMLDIHGVTQQYADKHIEIPQSWVESSDIARAAIANVKGAAP